MSSSKDSLNVILFGETGVGKSSVINLIAGEQTAKVSPDVEGCTMDSTDYVIPIEGRDVKIWDTVGLEEPEMGVNGYLTAIEKAHALICKLSEAGGVDLLLFCIRGSRITATTQSNYRLFYEVLCDKRVPIALVITNLEREVKMEDWWERNKMYIEKYGIHSAGHACVTGVQDEVEKYAQSRIEMLKLFLGAQRQGEVFDAIGVMACEATRGFSDDFLHDRNPPKGERMVRTLIKRCNMDGETARRLSSMISI
ncbi:P-loop containing nucleoside triphosphate hydrolase protein [Melanogaster broomeanus]|nr:P-loop containing nucleoside triphosphate hydrolase protein [Melanogaster broomeanus]